jgi:hypothetical protein
MVKPWLFALFALFTFTLVNASGPGTNWLYSRDCVINSTISSTLSNYPAYCLFDHASLVASGKSNVDASDWRMYQNDTPLVFGIENGTENTSAMVVWFNVPSFTTGNLTVTSYYGNPSATSIENMSGVWTQANAVYVQLCAGNLTNAVNASSASNPTRGSILYIQGQTGSACSFINNGDIATDVNNLPTGTQVRTMTTWVYPQTIGGAALNAIVGYGSLTANNAWYIAQYNTAPNGRIVTWIAGADPNFVDDNVVNNTWWFLANRYNSTGMIRNYQNGSFKRDTSIALTTSTADKKFFVRDTSSATLSNGVYIVDNARLYSDAKSDDWIKSEYQQQYFIGGETNSTASSFIVTLLTPTNNNRSSSGAITFTANVISTRLLSNFTFYSNFSGVWAANGTFLTPDLAQVISGIPQGTWKWNAYACDDVNNCSFAPTNFTFQYNTSAVPAPVYTYNQTLSKGLSDLAGSGFNAAFGNSLVIGLFILIIFLGLLVALKFSFDVILVLMAVIIIGLTGLQSNQGIAPYGILPAWMNVIILLVVAGIAFFAIMKFFRR